MKNVFLPLLVALLAAIFLPVKAIAQSTNVRAPNKNQSARFKSAIVKGAGNLIQSNATASFVGGGQSNAIGIAASNGVVGGGFGNIVSNNFGTVAGGLSNNASGQAASVVGGQANTTRGNFSVAGGGRGNFIASNSTASTIGGGFGNTVSATDLDSSSGFDEQSRSATATVAGGSGNTVSAGKSAIGGGEDNLVAGAFSVIAGGRANFLDGSQSVLAGGFENTMSNVGDSALVGGFQNTIAASASASSILDAFIGGGRQNTITNTADGAVISGGTRNTNSGTNATIPGGIFNEAKGNNSFAAGAQAKAEHNGAFVWGGDASTLTTSTNNNSFTVRATGGVRFITTIGSSFSGVNTNNGVFLAPGANTWAALSDSNAKTAIRPINSRAILRKLAELPVTEWQYKGQPERNYIGPMAQDFHAAFGLGYDDKTIATADTDGVMYAAIQGLVEELKERDLQQGKDLAERDAKIDRLEKELAVLRARLDNLPPSP